MTTPTKDACNKALSADDRKYFESCCYVKFREDGHDKDSEGCLPLTKYKFEHIKDANTIIINLNIVVLLLLNFKAHYIIFGLLS